MMDWLCFWMEETASFKAVNPVPRKVLRFWLVLMLCKGYTRRPRQLHPNGYSTKIGAETLELSSEMVVEAKR